MLLSIENLRKTYRTKDIETEVLRGVNFSVEDGEFVAIIGESGSGKTTLLNIIASFESADEGKVILNNIDILKLKDKEKAEFRRKKLGFVFQEYNILDNFSNKDNVLLPLVLSDVDVKTMEKQLFRVSKFLEIDGILDKYPYEISGGQRQRLAIARGIITEPELLLADEPTGALDSRSSDSCMNLFRKINGENRTILMVTHSLRAASFASRVLFIRDGVIFHELYRKGLSQIEFQEMIGDTFSLLNRGIL